MRNDVFFRIPLNPKDIAFFLEEEEYYLKEILNTLTNLKKDGLSVKSKETINELLSALPQHIDKIYPSKEPSTQIKALQNIAIVLSKAFKKITLEELGINKKWISLTNGYLGKIVDEDYEIAILLYLTSAIYQTRALAHVQTSSEYRYYYVSSLAALLAAKAFIEKINPAQNDGQANTFYQMLLLRKLEIESEITKSEAFLARKNGDFDRAAKLFAGAASYRFSMMNYDLPEDADNRVKIFASTELGMACFYLAVGLTNKNEQERAHLYLLKAKNYFENAAKLSENNTELLEAANKRLELVNPYIDKMKDIAEKVGKDIQQVADPQPLMIHSEPEPILNPKADENEISRICSNCGAKVLWVEKCSKCGEMIIPII